MVESSAMPGQVNNTGFAEAIFAKGSAWRFAL